VSITVSATMQYAEQQPEFFISNVNTIAGSTMGKPWQTSPTFDGLTIDTTYYIFARSRESTNYFEGTTIDMKDFKTIAPLGSTLNITINAVPDAATSMLVNGVALPNIQLSSTTESVVIAITGVTGHFTWYLSDRAEAVFSSSTSNSYTLTRASVIPVDLNKNLYVTVVVVIDGRPYSLIIPFTVIN